jgi:hypothetical protein
MNARQWEVHCWSRHQRKDQRLGCVVSGEQQYDEFRQNSEGCVWAEVLKLMLGRLHGKTDVYVKCIQSASSYLTENTVLLHSDSEGTGRTTPKIDRHCMGDMAFVNLTTGAVSVPTIL